MLYRRYWRECKAHFGIYLSVILLIMAGFGCVLGGNMGDDGMIAGVQKAQEQGHLADGYVNFIGEITQEEQDKAKDAGITLRENFYMDADAQNDTTLRIFDERTEVSLPTLEEGSLPSADTEILLEKHYAEAQSLTPGDTITVGEKDLTVSGIAVFPDYLLVLENLTDLSSNTAKFSVAMMTAQGFDDCREALGDDAFTVCHYTVDLAGGKQITDAEAFLDDEVVMPYLELVDRDNDPRITTLETDCALMKRSTMVFAVIYMIIVAYVLSIFLVNLVERESSVIGTLSAMGYRRHELILHYLGVPALVSVIGGITSLIAGYFLFSKLLTADSAALYSVPHYTVSLPLYAVVIALTVPAGIMVLVGWWMLMHRISSRPLELMRRSGAGKVRFRAGLEKIGYLAAFRIRQFFTELGGNLVMAFGILAVTVLLMLSLSMYGSLEHYKEIVAEDIPYQHLWTVMYQGEAPDTGESVLVQTMYYQDDTYDAELNITLMGISEDSDYFGFTPGVQASHLTISDAFAEKFGIHTGDSITLLRGAGREPYAFTAGEIVPYSNALTVFMERDALNKLLDNDEGYFNAVISHEDQEPGNLPVISHLTTQDYVDAAQSFLDSLMLVIGAMMGAAMMIFIMVIYLMIKFIIEKSRGNISLLRIMGYRDREVNRIYLGSETYVVMAAILISIPLSLLVMGRVFPYLMAGSSVSLSPYLPLSYCLALVGFEVVTYAVIWIVLKGKMKQIDFTEILKERE